MSLSHRSRRAAAAGLGSLALVLFGGPASAAALDTPVPALTSPLQVVVDSVAPVAAPVAEVVAPTTAPVAEVVAPTVVPVPAPTEAPQPREPVRESPAPVAPSPTVPAPADPVGTIVESVPDLVEQEEPPAAPPVQPPVQPNPVAGQGSAPVPVDGPARPGAQAPRSAAPAPATSGTAERVTAEQATGGSVTGDGAPADFGSGAAKLGSLGAFARDMAGVDEPAVLAPPGSSVAGTAPSLALPGMQPQLSMGEEVITAERSGSGAPASLPALLVGVAAAAVAVSAVGQVTEVRRRRQRLDG